ncbi:MAG: hypothetical protein M3497_05605 [Gemmatimonadota bacterium]|jgi:uncharacterized membrane protein YagU involved in acid resistance|nr:hypothetical protein [Gemmatimonadota bacterium]
MAEIAVERQARSQSIDWSAAIWAGVIAGTVFLMMEMFLMPLFGFAPSIWAPPRMIGAIGLGESALPPPATFDLGVVMVAMMIHFATSILFAIVVALIIRSLGMGAAIAVGVVAALLLYVFVFYIMTAGPWPWFANARNWLSIVVHIVFGALVAWWYKARAHPAEERAGV